MALGNVNAQGSNAAEIESVRTLAQTANDTANAAKNAAGTAKSTADAALEAANAAAGTASTAKTTADEALEAANAAAGTASDAKTAADEALEKANGVSGTADEALTAAQNAQTAADSALQAVTKLTSSINAVPSQSGILTYTGSAQSPTWNSYDTEKLTIGGTTSGTAAGTYTATFTPKDGYEWSDGTKDAKSVNWTIGNATVALPTQSGTLTYSGSEQTPSWSGYDSGKLTIGGTTKGTNAGTYTATFTPKTNYQWSDGSTTAKTATWSIGKATGSSSLSPTSLTLDVSNLSKDITVTRPGDGAVTASSSNTSIAAVSYSGTTVTVTGKAAGTATITVKVAAGTNYTAPADKTLTVTVDMPTNTLNDNSWATISAVSIAGDGDLYWEVGDAKEETFSGKVGNCLTLSNKKLYPFILGFNHKDGGVADNNIMWGCFKSAASGGTTIALYDSKYSPDNSWSSYTDGTKCMTMNHWGNYNYGGWKGCDLRYDILGATSTQPSGYGSAVTTSRVGYDATATTLTSPKADTLLAAFPSDMRSAMRLRTHYADSKGNSSNTAANVTAVVDAISLLMEFEVFGSRSYANTYEQNQQSQFDYFKNGNSKKWYKYDNTGTEVSDCWLGSARYTDASGFCRSNEGSANGSYAARSFAVPAAFKT